jgi:Cft2 family RNA processing exonuclease
MLGSKQLVLDSDDWGRVVYTGDFQMQRCRVAKPIVVKQCDTLIIDSTFPTPEFVFDERSEVECAIQKWAARKLDYGLIVFGAYAMGKAQELVAILNEVGITPVVSNKIARISEVYNASGIKLDYISAAERVSNDMRAVGSNFVLITEKPTSMVAASLSNRYNRRVFTGVATGFAKRFVFDTDVQFALSDHADFYQSLDYIKACGAKKVLTYGKTAEIFAESLKREKIDAHPFEM